MSKKVEIVERDKNKESEVWSSI